MMAEQLISIAVTLLLLLCCFVPRDETQCNFIGAVIGGVAGLIGASKQRKENRRVNEANRPVNQVREWEEAGINPLFGISSGGYIPHQAASIGDSYATAGARFGQAIDAARAEKLEQTELKQENRELREKLDELATPRVPSYMSQYGAIMPLPTIGDTDARSDVARSTANRTAVRDRDYGYRSTGSKTGTHDPALDYQAPDYGVIQADGAGATSIVTNPGYVEHLGQFYGDEVADFEGAINYAKDWWYGQVIGDAYIPGWGWESQMLRPKKRPATITYRANRPPKANTKSKAYRDFMKDAYPTAFD